MKTPLIIERPDLQAWQQKAVFGTLTALFWVVWVFLWLPLITLLGWFFFGYQFHFHMIELSGYARFLNVLIAYAMVIGVMGGALIVWAMYNNFRFQDTDRRKDVAAPSIVEIGRWANHSASAVAQWRNGNIVTVHHDQDGGIARVELSGKRADARVI